MKFKLTVSLSAAAALLFAVSFNAGRAEETKAEETPKPRTSKYKKTVFTKDHFSIAIPAEYYTAEEPGKDVRTYTSSDYPHGIVSVMCMTAPEHTSVSPLVLKQLVEKLTPNKKSIDKETPIKLDEYSGTQWDITNNVDTPQNGCRVRGYIAGRRVYILMAYGTKPWLNSDGIKKFMDSLEINP